MERERAINHKAHDRTALPRIEQLVESPGQMPTAQVPVHLREWWLIEIWKDSREAFKTLIEHALGFLALTGLLVSINLIAEASRLSQPHKDIIESIDFYGIVLALGMFTLDFILKLIILIHWKSRD